MWHTKTKSNSPSKRDILKSKYDGTNLRYIQDTMVLKPSTIKPSSTQKASAPTSDNSSTSKTPISKKHPKTTPKSSNKPLTSIEPNTSKPSTLKPWLIDYRK